MMPYAAFTPWTVPDQEEYISDTKYQDQMTTQNSLVGKITTRDREGVRTENICLSFLLTCHAQLYTRQDKFYFHNVTFPIYKCYVHRSRPAILSR